MNYNDVSILSVVKISILAAHDRIFVNILAKMTTERLLLPLLAHMIDMRANITE